MNPGEISAPFNLQGWSVKMPDALQSAIFNALRWTPQAVEQQPKQPAPSSEPSPDNPRDNPNALVQRSLGGSASGAEGQVGGAPALSRALSRFSGYVANPTLDSVATALGNAFSIGNPVRTAMMTGLSELTGAPLGGLKSVPGNMTQSALDNKAQALGLGSLAQLAKAKMALGLPAAVAINSAAAQIANAALGMPGNAAIGTAFSTTAARNRAYGPAFSGPSIGGLAGGTGIGGGNNTSGGRTGPGGNRGSPSGGFGAGAARGGWA